MNSTTAALPRYTTPAIALHWLLAVAIVAIFALGVQMSSMPFSPRRLQFFNWHKWAGVAILALSALRLLWRLTHRPPAVPAAPGWQQAAAHATHLALYALFFAVPLVGWAYSSAAGFPIVFLGVLPLPDFVPADRELAELLKPWHGRLAWAMAALVALHVAAAFKHHFVDGDGLLHRMRPALR